MIQKLKINPVTGQLDVSGLEEVKWGGITGDINDQTDLINLLIANTPTLQEVTDIANVTSNNLIVTKPFIGSSSIIGGIITNIQSGSNTASLLDSRKLSVENLSNNFKTNLTFPISTQENTINLKNSSGTIAFLSDITGTNSGTNTGDETTISIQTKRPLKTIEGQILEGIGNIDLNNKENLINKTTNFNIINDSLYPSIAAVSNYSITSQYDPNNTEVFRDDFITGSNETGEIGKLNWGFNNGQVFLLNGIDGHPGIFRRTGSTDNQVAPFYLGTASGFLPFQVKDLLSTIYIFRGTDLANQFTMQLGISSDFGVLNPTNSIYLRKTNLEATFFAVNRSAGIETSVNTGTSFVQNQWYKLEIINDLTNNTSIFKLNNIIVATIITNKPALTSNINIGGNIVRISAANRNLDIDYISFITKTTNR